MIDTNIINKQLIEFDEAVKTKEDALKEIARIVYKAGRVTNRESFLQGLLNREKEFTTGFGDGIAIPHAKIEEVNKATICILKLQKPINWESMDGKPVQLVIAMGVPAHEEGKLHLKLLATLSEQLMEEDFKEALLSAKTKDDVYSTITDIFE